MAIVLHSMKFGESQMIVDILTQEHGRLPFICHLPKSSKGKIKKQFFQPLSLLEIEYDFRLKSKFQHFKDIRVAVPFSSLPFDPFKLSIALFLAEFLSYSTRNEQNNSSLFLFVVKSVEWLDATDRDFSNFHLIFMVHLSTFLGFMPNVEEYRDGDFFDLREGRFVSGIPGHSDFLFSADAEMLQLLFRLSYKTMHLCKMSRIERNRCTEVIVLYYRLHIPNFPEMKSLDVLKQLFS